MKFELLFVFACLALLACAENAKCGENCTWEIVVDDKIKLYITGTGKMTDFTAVENAPWYEYHDSISKVEVDEIENIGAYAFKDFSNLTKLELHSEVKVVGKYAFQKCTKLEEIEEDYWKVQSIEAYAFEGCTALRKVKFPEETQVIQNTAFMDCPALEKLKVDGDNEVFWDEEGVLFASLEKIPTLFRFPPNYSATEYAIPNKTERVNNYAFYGASKLKSLYINKELAFFSEYALQGAVNLESISVDEENEDFITDTVALVSKDEGVIKYPAKHAGTSYDVPNVTTIATLAFENAANLKTIKVPATMKTISTYAFKGCSSLETVNIPKATFTIGTDIFEGCTGLKEVTVEAGNTAAKSDNGVFYSTGYGGAWNLAKYPAKKADKSYTILDKTAKISSHAFENATELESIDIPASVESIGFEAFLGCKKLATAEYHGTKNPGSSSSIVDCDALKSVCVPNNYTADKFCGIAISKCHESGSGSKASSKAGSAMTIPSALAVLLAILALLF